MTNEELNKLLKRVDNMSAQLDAITEGINKRQDELDDLWAQYWRVFGKLTDEIKIDEMNATHKQKEEV